MNREKSPPSLKLAHLPKPIPQLRLGGMEPPPEMSSGEYKMACEGASKKMSGKGLLIELKHRVIDGPYTGVSLRQWITVDSSGVISPNSRYAQQCAVALGRQLSVEDNLDNPASIFVGRIFSAFVGFRHTDKPRGGKYAEGNAHRRKDAADGLRVHELLRR